MRRAGSIAAFSSLCFLSTVVLCSCSSESSSEQAQMGGMSPNPYEASYHQDYSSRVPEHISTTEKTVVVNPNTHVWAAYEDGSLVKAGLASAGADYCPDIGRRCHTSSGTFHVFSLGDPDCKSRTFPVHKGGAPMPYCMYFAHGMALHGVPDNEVGEGNYSHGCVRLHVADAEWLRYNFVNIGTRVVVESY